MYATFPQETAAHLNPVNQILVSFWCPGQIHEIEGNIYIYYIYLMEGWQWREALLT